MLSIGRLGPAGGAAYYLRTVGAGVDDYYVSNREAAGRWVGGGAAMLGLEGEVGAQGFGSVLAGVDPITGRRLGRAGRRVPGFDLTFSAPKSVSVLWGLNDRDIAEEMRAAHDTAVSAALEYVEAEVLRTRRGRNGVEQVPTRGLIGAAFVHRTSRAGDPQVHTHVVVANSVQAVDDGSWRTLDSRALYRHARTAGCLYQAQLRAELSRRLGVEWGQVLNGCADIVGIPRRVLDAFSQRRVAIVELLTERGQSSLAAAQSATLETRQAKDGDAGRADLRVEWRRRAVALGLSRDQLIGVTGRRSWQSPTPEELGDTVARLVSPEGLTAHVSTVARRDVLRGWCEALRDGADVAHVRALADWLTDPATKALVPLDHPIAVARRLADDKPVDAGLRELPAERRWSTPELLTTEAAALTMAMARQHERTAVAATAEVERSIRERPSLSAEQAAMVRHLTLDGAGVHVVVGKAGTGKTFALDAARAAFEASGIRVQGCALAARAAAELEAGAGVPSTTLVRTMTDLAVDALRSRRGSRVVVLDEAAMVGTRDLARLLEQAEQLRLKVILVGDHHQLPEIQAGGLFHTLVNRLPAIELTENRRQTQAWEREALDQLRHGDPATALQTYGEHGRVVTRVNADRLRDELVDDWHRAHGSGQQALMIAATNADVADLNDRARQRLQRAGPLKGSALVSDDGREFQVGDRVIALRNRHRLELLNGTRATVTTIDHDTRALTAALDGSGREVTIDAGYLDAGHLDHGYAVTCHKAQGATVEAAFTLGSDRLYRELAYVALSRGRQTNTLYTVAGTDLSRALEQSRQQHLALELGR